VQVRVVPPNVISMVTVEVPLNVIVTRLVVLPVPDDISMVIEPD
jgi:hypothetical protein